MEGGHSPEPWRIDMIEGGMVRLTSSIVDKEGETVCHDEDYYPQAMKPADQARTVACVNGCAGMNPEAVPDLMKSLRHVLSEINNRGFLTMQSFGSARESLLKAEGRAKG